MCIDSGIIMLPWFVQLYISSHMFINVYHCFGRLIKLNTVSKINIWLANSLGVYFMGCVCVCVCPTPDSVSVMCTHTDLSTCALGSCDLRYTWLPVWGWGGVCGGVCLG